MDREEMLRRLAEALIYHWTNTPHPLRKRLLERASGGNAALALRLEEIIRAGQPGTSTAI